jgi:hypothetical protein
MNVGTVWIVDHDFAVIVGDEIRFTHIVTATSKLGICSRVELAQYVKKNREGPDAPNSRGN